MITPASPRFTSATASTVLSVFHILTHLTLMITPASLRFQCCVLQMEQWGWIKWNDLNTGSLAPWSVFLLLNFISFLPELDPLYFWNFSACQEKATAPHSSTLAWKIPWTEEPDGLQSMGSLGVGHDWATSLSLFTFMHWRRKWQPTPVFLPGESQGRGSLVGCHLWGRTESDTTGATQQQPQQQLMPHFLSPITSQLHGSSFWGANMQCLPPRQASARIRPLSKTVSCCRTLTLHPVSL